LCFHPGGPCRPTLRPIHPHLAPFLPGATPPLADVACPSLIGPRGRCDHNDAEQAAGISKDVALAAMHCRAVVTSALRPSHLGGFDRRALEPPRRGMVGLRLLCSDACAYRLGYAHPSPRAFPGAQVMRDTVPLGEIGGQPPPLAPAFGDLKNGLEHSPHAQGARPSPAFGGGDQRCHPLPFCVGQVAWRCFFIHISILHNPRRLFRQPLRGEPYVHRGVYHRVVL
jgi:hypothetical protein